jgi:arsenate reductase-like glutaredoxin family protein
MPAASTGLVVANAVSTALRSAQALVVLRPVEVQVFGVRKSADTRKALRFFAERRVTVHFVDLTKRAASAGELRRFAQKFGVQSLVDRESNRFRDLGLTHASFAEPRWLDRLVEEPLLLRMPLVRSGNRLTIGRAEAEWQQWLEPGRDA